MLAFTYKIVADAYYSSGQSLLAIDHLKKAIQCFKESYDQGISPDKPYHGVVQKQHNAKIIECYNRLADIYRGIDNSEAADDAVRKTSTDLITIDDNLEHDLLIQDLAICHSVNLGPEALDQALIDALLMVQSQVKQTKIFKCLNGHELQSRIVQLRHWRCNKCERQYQGDLLRWNCCCLPYGYDKCGTCIAKELFYFNNALLANILK
ncbi:unnamed protein product [Rotaria socialis]|nr:unnamed protein product [Rotaria socialis]CAF3726810.1 unnamed protein product [Rotaria socialis]